MISTFHLLGPPRLGMSGLTNIQSWVQAIKGSETIFKRDFLLFILKSREAWEENSKFSIKHKGSIYFCISVGISLYNISQFLA